MHMLAVIANVTVQVFVKPHLETYFVCCLVLIYLFLFCPPACNGLHEALSSQANCMHLSVCESSFATIIQAQRVIFLLETTCNTFPPDKANWRLRQYGSSILIPTVFLFAPVLSCLLPRLSIWALPMAPPLSHKQR